MNHCRTATTWMLLSILFAFAWPTTCQLFDLIESQLKLITEPIKNDVPDQTDFLSEYDFIIIGAGTAGCVLANRLTEISHWKILLLEAGGDETMLLDIPVAASYVQLTPASWKYKTEPSEQYCTGLDNKQCFWPRGKTLGGSSALNFMIYTRGSQNDYDNWKAMGNDGWGWEDVLPYFKKIENFNISSIFNSTYHSKDGHVNVEYSPYRSQIAEEWVKAAQELGFKYVDYNGVEPAGVSYLQLSMKDGVRHSSNTAYLYPAKDRNNLHVSKNSFVTKLLFDDTNTKVIGVEFEKEGKKHSILSKREVIVSAGVINSPQLLMLSGVGHREHLESMEINVVKDLPVGHNLMDHVAVGGLNFLVNSSSISLDNTMNIVNDWMKNRTSPLSLAGGCEALVFMDLKDKFNTTLWPDLELLFVSMGLNFDPITKRVFNFDTNTFAKVYGPLGNSSSFMVLPMLLRPKSRGKILLRSRDPNVHPKLIPNYFQYEEDLKNIVKGVKVAIEISEQPSMKEMGAKIYNIPIEECLKEGVFGGDAYFACQARKFTFSIYHQSGTCKMGIESDSTSVVDPRLRVHGIKNLRVIDASIMPEIVSVHTNAPTYMIAEKGADIIKQDWDVSL